MGGKFYISKRKWNNLLGTIFEECNAVGIFNCGNHFSWKWGTMQEPGGQMLYADFHLAHNAAFSDFCHCQV